MTAIALEDRTRDLGGRPGERAVAGMPARIQRFSVRALIGTGGMGAVYRAHDPQLAREVAIKLIAEPTSTEGLSAESTLDLRIAKAAAADDLLS
ncbi:MAG TPA: hypothetical protein VLB44_03255, partial [Kofleriaceae bacterium]|nr:hypothetical protein [Kofleriaceae bacterium]